MRAKGKKPAPSRGESSSSSVSGIEARVDALAEILRRHELNEIEVEEAGVRIYVRRGGGVETVVHGAAAAFHAPPVTPHAPPPTASGAPPPSTSSTDTGDG